MTAPLTHASLFTGLGGFDQGAARAGIPTIWTCEADTWLRNRLKNHNPSAIHYEDVQTLLDHAPERATIISGGFPCQDLSRVFTKTAGGQKGLEGDRSSLWYKQLDIIGALRPQYAIIENVPALAGNGLDTVLAGLASIRYDAEWTDIRAEWFGLGHRRERLIIIAYPTGVRQSLLLGQGQREIERIHELSYTQANPCIEFGSMDEASNYCHVRANDGLADWTNRIKAIGNGFPVHAAHFLFELIKRHYQQTQ